MSVAPQANQAPPAPPGLALPPPPPAATPGGIASEIDAELQGQISPLEIEAGGFERAESRAVQDLNALFAGLMPFVAGSAQRVAETYGATNAAQASVFNQAWERLNSLRGERAAQAQALAQQIGAPVPLDNMFTQAIDIERGAFVPEAAGQLLASSTIGQAGVQEAEAFAGRVMPLKQARMTAEVHSYYRDQISDLRKQIAAIKSMRPGLINERLRQRQLEDYQMRLDRAEALFARQQTKASLALEQKRLRLQQQELAEQKRQANLGVSENAKDRAHDSAEAAKNRKFRANQSAQEKKIANRTYVNNSKQNIVGLTMALAGGGATEYKDFKTLVRNPDGTVDSVTETRALPGAQPIRNPLALLEKTLATAGIKKGQKELYNFAVAQVIRALQANGVRGIPNDPKKWGKWWKDRQRGFANRGKRHGNPFPEGRH